MPALAKFKPVIKEIPCPGDGLAIFRSIAHRPYSFFLDSACDAKKLGRFSFIGCDPFLVFKSKGDSVAVEHVSGRTEKFKADPFVELKKLMKQYAATSNSKGFPFVGGAVGYLSYDLKDFIEDLPSSAVDDLSLPDCVFGFYDSVVIYDNLKKKCYISNLGISKRPSPWWEEIISHSEEPFDKLQATRNLKPLDPSPATFGGKAQDDVLNYSYRRLRSNFSKRSYACLVAKAKSYIKKGDIYQVNISQRFQAEFSGDTIDLYARLRSLSPAPFASHLNFGDAVILSSSPERFLLKRGKYVETRPIKGTRPRGENAAHDARLETELKKSAKDMAEHIMIVDLERNDLGRICEYGSVHQTESAIIEKYANVFHLVSTVTGTLKAGVDAVDCLMATFPGGSITGAPKIRSMEIIDELESVRRSVYTGAIGYIGFDGNMDTSIVIRTFLIKGKNIYFQVGGGIVADSDPEKEYDETLHKAAGLMKSLGMAREHEGCVKV